MLFDQIASNKRKTWIFVAGFFLLWLWLVMRLPLHAPRSWWHDYCLDHRSYLLWPWSSILWWDCSCLWMGRVRRANGTRPLPCSRRYGHGGPDSMPRAIIEWFFFKCLCNRFPNPQNAAVKWHVGALSYHESWGARSCYVGHERHIETTISAFRPLLLPLQVPLPFCLRRTDVMVGWGRSQRSDNDRDGNGLRSCLLSLFSHCSSTSCSNLVQLAISRQREFQRMHPVWSWPAILIGMITLIM